MFEKLKRFYIQNELKEEIEIEDDLYHQIKNVLRTKIGDKFIFINDKEVGEYQFYFGMKKSGIFTLNSKQPHDKPNYELDVYLSIIQREYLDSAIEKLGEIGITKLIPVITKRSFQGINTSTSERMKKLLYKGFLQAEHNFLPVVEDAVDLSDITPKTQENFVLYERCSSKEKIDLTTKSVGLLIGPEGGFEDVELETLQNKGFKKISPIKGVLKSETAAIIFTGYVKILIDTSGQ
ncbi:MAG: RsmE family RNA methyltransferase [Calditerrivibrio sp.]|nr:RsmE family RNA methyltransferase [Calditerrivibrio sp.]